VRASILPVSCCGHSSFAHGNPGKNYCVSCREDKAGPCRSGYAERLPLEEEEKWRAGAR
jgi:hypothetical protein